MKVNILLKFLGLHRTSSSYHRLAQIAYRGSAMISTYHGLAQISSRLIILCSVCSISLVSCKKDNPAPTYSQVNNGNTNNNNGSGSGGDLRDSLANDAYVYYLWNNLIPNSFNPHSYPQTDTLTGLVTAIRSYSPLNSVNNLHYDHFSFVLTEADYQNLFVNGVSMGYGMDYKFDRSGKLRVAYSAHASAAYQQGVRRGWQITSVNGIAIATDAATIAKLNAALNSPTATFVFINPSTSNQVSVNLTQQAVADDEVISTNVFSLGTKTVGYIAYNTFLTATDKNGNPQHPGLDTAFAKLKSAGVSDLIIDLRYNGGGYTDIASEMDDALIPAANNGKILYSEHYNDTLNVNYKRGYKFLAHDTTINVNTADPRNPPNLNVNTVTFIVSSSTASASELTINNLLPYFSGNVKIIGVGYNRAPSEQNTAGKPFGYAYNFDLPTKNPQYVGFLINFESKNASGTDNYVSGFTPDLQTYDGVEFDWGNPSEDPLKAALAYINTGVLARPTNPVALSSVGTSFGPFGSRIESSGNRAAIGLNSQINSHRFVGMVNHSFLQRARRKSVQSVTPPKPNLSSLLKTSRNIR